MGSKKTEGCVHNVNIHEQLGMKEAVSYFDLYVIS